MILMGSLDEQGYVIKRLGIDFGMNSTVIAVSNSEGETISTVEFPGCSRRFPPGKENAAVEITPSLIHYTSTGLIIIGEQVNQKKYYDDPSTARWMKQYISQNSPAQFITGKDQVTGYRQAATDFLVALLSSPPLLHNTSGINESVFTFPVESPPCYISLA